MARTRWQGAVLLAAALTGCASTDLVDAPPATPAAVHQRWTGCDALGAFPRIPDFGVDPDAGSIPAGFVPTRAVVCIVQDAPGGDTSKVADVERRSDAIDPLLTYLARPSRISRDRDLACPAMAVSRLWLFLLDADQRWISPQPPTDPCGFPLGTFETEPEPYQTLPWTDTVVRTRPRT